MPLTCQNCRCADHVQHTLLVLLCLVVLDKLPEKRTLFRGQWLWHCGGRVGRVRSATVQVATVRYTTLELGAPVEVGAVELATERELGSPIIRTEAFRAGKRSM
jgi:hypothetical protein